MDETAGDPVLGFAAILCSRLCHDLVSPVGALVNGIEILAEEDDAQMRAQVLALLEDSARQTANRLQFFRLAFGAGGGFGKDVDVREARKAIEALLAGGKVALDWQAGEAVVRKDIVKLILNLALLASEALIRGGRLAIALDETGAGGLALRIGAEGERVIFNETAQAALLGRQPVDDIDPRCAPARLAHLIARQMGARIDVATTDPGTLAITAEIPDTI